MARDLHVTSVETFLPERGFIYSSTDLKGTIVEANPLFAQISGYTEEELVGKPHSMVRHPDMPREAFRDMWTNLTKGRPWQGVVKNRRKDGGYYWVVANASPIRQDGRIVGYQSIRTRPTRAQVQAAERAYRLMREGDLSLKVEDGRAVKVRSKFLDDMASIGFRVSVGMAMLLLASLVGVAGILFGSEMPWLHEAAEWVYGFGSLYALVMMVSYVPRMMRDLHAMEVFLDRALATGNLSERLTVERFDRIGRVGRKLELVMSWFQATLQCVQANVEQVEEASAHVAESVTAIDEAALSQSRSSSSVAAAVEEMTMSISEVADHLRNTEAAVEETGKKATGGAKLSQKASGQIQTLASAIREVSTEVAALGASTEEVGEIAGVIKEIADQTNLLALNASIEAARAGEAGRGFAVVANEVRMLADRTMQATRKIDQLIVTIQGDSTRAIGGMKEGEAQVGTSVRLVRDAEASLKEINEFMMEAVRKVSEISTASSQQSGAMRDIGGNIAQVAAKAEESLSSARKTSASMEHLGHMVDRVKIAIQQYVI